MKIIKILSTILFLFSQFTAIAQDKEELHQLTNAADSLAKLNKVSEATALYLKAISISDKDPILQRELAALYLKSRKTKNADTFIKLAIKNGADFDMLSSNTSIGNYLKDHPGDLATYVDLIKQHASSIQLKDKKRWIDPYRGKFFN